MRVAIRPSVSPHRELDVTDALIAAVAYELWKNGGGNEVLNWLEAERFVARLASGSPRDAARASQGRPRRGDAQPRRRPRRSEADVVPGPIPYL